MNDFPVIGEQETAIEQPAETVQSQLPMILVKTAWTEPGGDIRQMFQLMERSGTRELDQLRQEMLSRLQTSGRTDCAVEIYDPNNVPPGTIPEGVSITFGGAVK